MNSSLSVWQKLYKAKVHHVLVWALYYAFFFAMYKHMYTNYWHLLGVISIYFFFNATTFYFAAYYLMPRYLHTRQYIKFALSFIGAVLFFALGLAVCMYFMLHDYAPQFENKLLVYLIALLTIGTTVGGLSAVKLVVDKINGDRKTLDAERQRIESELQYLKAQVNPHFLFNAINSVYFLIKKDADAAASTLIKLSDLLRFQLYDCSDEKIPIEKEVEYLNNFVALEKIRKGDKIKVDLMASSELQGFQVAPFMLIPFLENAFKYVSGFSSSENKIIIKLWREDDKFHAHFFNTTDNLIRSDVGGIGHKNVKRRLELIYPNKHQLEILERPGTYKVMLSLDLT
jgi:two-component system, LytTR family, sensor kinase